MTISQFKYSIADESAAFRVSDAKETIEKFAGSYRSYKRKNGAPSVTQKLDFELVTNRPIYGPFQEAIDALKRGASTSRDAPKQVRQFATAADLKGKALAEFAGKLTLSGLSGSLPATKRSLAGLIVDWSGTDDLVASSRLGKIKDLVREKAGHAGSFKNLIKRTDILSELGIEDAEDLLPCKPACQSRKVVEREQLSEAVALYRLSQLLCLFTPAAESARRCSWKAWPAPSAIRARSYSLIALGAGVPLTKRRPTSPKERPHTYRKHARFPRALRSILPGTTDTQALLLTFRRRLAQCSRR